MSNVYETVILQKSNNPGSSTKLLNNEKVKLKLN